MAYLERKYGKNYNKDFKIVDITKAIRLELKRALKAGEIVGEYSVKKQSRSSIAVEMTGLRDGVLMFKPQYLVNKKHADLGQPPSFSQGRYSQEVETSLNKVREILDSYNYDGSDVQVDYHDVNFYSSVGVDYKLREEREKLESEGL